MPRWMTSPPSRSQRRCPSSNDAGVDTPKEPVIITTRTSVKTVRNRRKRPEPLELQDDRLEMSARTVDSSETVDPPIRLEPSIRRTVNPVRTAEYILGEHYALKCHMYYYYYVLSCEGPNDTIRLWKLFGPYHMNCLLLSIV